MGEISMERRSAAAWSMKSFARAESLGSPNRIPDRGVSVSDAGDHFEII